MTAKFSVRKPYTVLVAVILIIILGVVAFTRMTPDLLPDIELPYVVVATPYPGASPEKVEGEVTTPVEQAMATLDNISSINSTSSENFSMVILEFNDNADLDIVTGQIREKTNELAASWSDGIGSTFIMKLSPDLIPVSVAAVSLEGEDTYGLTSFVDSTLLARLRGIDGVASVNAGGMISETTNVLLSEKRIEETNQRIHEAIDKQFAEHEKEIADARAELEDGKKTALEGKDKIAQGYEELSKAKKTAEAELAKAKATLDQKGTELAEGKAALIAAAEQLQTNLDEVSSLEEMLVTASESYIMIDEAKAALEPAITSLETVKQTVTLLEGAREVMISALVSGGMTREEAVAYLTENSEAFQKIEEGLAEIDASLAEYGTDRASLNAYIALVSAQYAEAVSAEAKLDTALEAAGITRDGLPDAIKAAGEARGELTAALDEVNKMLADAEAGGEALAEAEKTLASSESAARRKFNEAYSELENGETELESVLGELDAAFVTLEEGEEGLEEAKETAYTAADLSKLMTLKTVGAILAANNLSMPAGYVEENGESWLVRVGDGFEETVELQSLVLFDLGIEGLEPITLSDVADIFTSDNSDSSYARINGQNGILISFNKQSNYDTSTVSVNIKETFDELSEEYPGLEFSTLMDQGSYIELLISSVLENLALGALLAVVILLFFLRDLRPTFVVALSIPVSVTFAIVLMYFSGVTLNIISMSGLAVSVGMLVDNSIVVIENIYRLRSEGVEPVKAAIKGASDVSAAIVASTLTTVCVFFPIVFVEGLTRQLFTDMALTITYSLVASLIIAMTLVPAVSKGLLKKVSNRDNKLHRGTLTAYNKVIKFVLSKKVLTLLVALALLVSTAALELTLGFTYMPAVAGEEISITMTRAEDMTDAEFKTEADSLSAGILELDGIETVGATYSNSMASIIGLGQSSSSSTSITMYVLGGGNNTVEYIKLLSEKLRSECEVSGESNMSGFSTALGGEGITVNIYCEDLTKLREYASKARDIFLATEGIESADDGSAENTPVLKITVDKNKAAQKGLTVASVYADIANSLVYEGQVTEINGEAVLVTDEAASHIGLDALRSHEISATGLNGEEIKVSLSDIAEITEEETQSSIAHKGQRRSIGVNAVVAEGYNVTLVADDVEKAFEESFPSSLDVRYEFTGENETIIGAMKDLALMLLLGIVIVYLIMVAQFQSLSAPFIVMFTIPLAFTGAFAALLICGLELSIVSMIGLVMLVGIIVNNGIVLIDCIISLRAEGMNKREAIIEACGRRLRPVLMTALTTILGLLPMALGLGMGAALIQPVAIAAIGGLIYATAMTLVVIPVLYMIMGRKDSATN